MTATASTPTSRPRYVRTERSAHRQRPERTPWLRRRPSGPVTVAGLGVIVTAMRQEIYLNVTLGTLVAVALLPVWLPTFRRYRGATLLGTLVVLCIPAGVWLTSISAETRVTSARLLVASTLLLLNVLLGAGLILWAREHMANYKVPRMVRFYEALPVNASNKVAKNELRSLIL